MIFHSVQHPILTPELNSLTVIPISDTHIGDPNHDEKALAETLYKARQTNALLILLGDIINNGIKSSVSNTYEETMKPSEQVKYVASLLEPYKDLIVGAVEGNHERRTSREVDQSPAERYSEKLGIPFLGDEALLKLKFGKTAAEGGSVVYSLFATHGCGGGRTAGGRINGLSRLSDVVVADVLCQGHTHALSCHNEQIYLPDLRTEKVNVQDMTFVSCGNYLRRGGYAAQKTFAPLKLGSPLIQLNGKKKEVSVTL